MEYLLPLLIVILLIIVGLFVFLRQKRKSFGTIATGNMVYTDTEKIRGEVLYSERLKLKGKPDYIIKNGQEHVPVEVKTGKTPSTPYRNHVAQLYAYCALIEDNFDSRPKYGVIKYPEKEFKIEYTEDNRIAVEKLIQEMIQMKKNDSSPQCNHPNHNMQ